MAAHNAAAFKQRVLSARRGGRGGVVGGSGRRFSSIVRLVLQHVRLGIQLGSFLLSLEHRHFGCLATLFYSQYL